VPAESWNATAWLDAGVEPMLSAGGAPHALGGAAGPNISSGLGAGSDGISGMLITRGSLGWPGWPATIGACGSTDGTSSAPSPRGSDMTRRVTPCHEEPRI